MMFFGRARQLGTGGLQGASLLNAPLPFCLSKWLAAQGSPEDLSCLVFHLEDTGRQKGDAVCWKVKMISGWLTVLLGQCLSEVRPLALRLPHSVQAGPVLDNKMTLRETTWWLIVKIAVMYCFSTVWTPRIWYFIVICLWDYAMGIVTNHPGLLETEGFPGVRDF